MLQRNSKIILTIILVLSTALFSAASAQNKVTKLLNYKLEKSSDKPILTWIYFSDKGNNVSAYLNNPSSIVSAKSLKRRAKYLPQDQLVDFTDVPINSVYLRRLENSGVKIKQKSKWLNAVSAYLSKEQIGSLKSFTFVKKLDLVRTFKKAKPVELTNDDKIIPSENEIAGTHSYNYGASYTQLNQINVPAVHDLGYTGAGITICLMDAGFSLLSHEVFDNMNIVDTWDFVNGDADVSNGSDMGDGSHGTETLSTIGGFKEGELIGPAFGANYLLAKTENTESETPIEEDNWAAALEWADDRGVDVTSTSLGYLSFDPPYDGYTWEDMDGNTAVITIAADLAVKKGIVVVNSAGNEGYNATHNTLGAPADGDSVITVGAVTSSGSRSSFSSVGNTVDGRIKPDVMAMGSSVTVASPYSATGYTTSSGTSFSCPLAAGVAALILEYNPNLPPILVRDIMRSAASNADNPDREYGWGILNALEAINNAIIPDSTPPDAITDLSIPNRTSNSLTIEWTTPVDTTVQGVVAFDIRYSNSPITEAGFSSAAQIPFTGTVGDAGSVNTLTVNNLPFETTYYFAIKSADIFNNWSPISNQANGTTLAAPVISVTPEAMHHDLAQNQTLTDFITVLNQSENSSTLDFAVTTDNNTFPEGSVKLKIKPKPEIQKSASNETISKTAEEKKGMSIQGAGGPDVYGYEWIDSDETGGPQYVWNDISATGTEVTNWDPTGAYNELDEGYAGPINLGINFKFYGDPKTQIYFSTNGYITFVQETDATYSNKAIPNSFLPNDMICAFWDDLTADNGGRLYYKTDGNKFIVQFTDWKQYNGAGTYTYQYVLYSTGRIMVYYKSMSGDLQGATVGIENADGTDGLQIAYNAPYIHNDMAVKISSDPEWLTVQDFSGTIYSGFSAQIELLFEANEYPEGDYSMDVIITSNDPNAPEKIVPVTMTIDNNVPVELTSFSANAVEGNVLLTWKTATETNNKGFQVQRKKDKVESEWKEIGFVEGNGTTADGHSYSFVDEKPGTGLNKYRLKQIDFDGGFEYSAIVETELLPTEFKLFQNYPNPFNPATTVKFQLPEQAVVNIALYDILGRKVKELFNQSAEAGTYKIQLDGNNLGSGVYILQMNADGADKNYINRIKINLIK
ncbi:MAG: S8 family serine peptidase [Chlorobi bacterium]|nr:S8 family serine peptidase [Chlorobiota bacterium]